MNAEEGGFLTHQPKAVVRLVVIFPLEILCEAAGYRTGVQN
ncbi:hypothetical protein [Nostoc sp. TCL26-01]|nr:hypothetical protein [Nostoc sp. TCL26-01]